MWQQDRRLIAELGLRSARGGFRKGRLLECETAKGVRRQAGGSLRSPCCWLLGWASRCPPAHKLQHPPLSPACFPACRALQEGQAPYYYFLAVSISSGVGAIFVFCAVMAYCRWKRLI